MPNQKDTSAQKEDVSPTTTTASTMAGKRKRDAENNDGREDKSRHASPTATTGPADSAAADLAVDNIKTEDKSSSSSANGNGHTSGNGNNGRKSGRPPTRRGGRGRNQYTRDKERRDEAAGGSVNGSVNGSESAGNGDGSIKEKQEEKSDTRTSAVSREKSGSLVPDSPLPIRARSTVGGSSTKDETEHAEGIEDAHHADTTEQQDGHDASLNASFNSTTTKLVVTRSRPQTKDSHAASLSGTTGNGNSTGNGTGSSNGNNNASGQAATTGPAPAPAPASASASVPVPNGNANALGGTSAQVSASASTPAPAHAATPAPAANTSGAGSSSSTHAASGATPGLPHHGRLSMNDMRRRVAAILEFISRTQLDMAANGERITPPKKDVAERIVPGNDSVSAAAEAVGLVRAEEGKKEEGKKEDAGGEEKEVEFEKLSSFEMMDVLTRGLLKWQQEYGKYGDR